MSAGTVIQAWVPNEVAEEIRRIAEDEDRSVSNVVRRAITQYLAKDGSVRSVDGTALSVEEAAARLAGRAKDEKAA